MLVLLLAACGPAAPPEPGDCLPTYGDNCDCDPKCMTEAELQEARKDGPCDLVCDVDGNEPFWACTVVDGVCVVVEDSG